MERSSSSLFEQLEGQHSPTAEVPNLQSLKLDLESHTAENLPHHDSEPSEEFFRNCEVKLCDGTSTQVQ